MVDWAATGIQTNSTIIKGAVSSFCFSLLGFAGFLGFWDGACGAVVTVAPGTSSITASLSSTHTIHGFMVDVNMIMLIC